MPPTHGASFTRPRQLEVGLQFLVGYVREDYSYVDNPALVFWRYVSSPSRFWSVAAAASARGGRLRLRAGLP